MTSPESAPTRPRRSALIGCITPPIGVFVIGSLIAVVTAPPDSFGAGWMVGSLATFAVVPGLVGGLVIYLGRKEIGWLLIAVTVAGLSSVILVTPFDGPSPDAERANFVAGSNDGLTERGLAPIWSHEGDTLLVRPTTEMVPCETLLASLDHAVMGRYFRAVRCVDATSDQTVELSE